MKIHLILSAGLVLAFSTLRGAAAVVNVDFDGTRDDDAGAGTYVGVSSAGNGTLWNGISVESSPTHMVGANDDNLTVTGSGLLDDSGIATSVGFTIGPVGGDQAGFDAPAALVQDYIFNNSAGNSTPGGSPFTISGLGSAATADLYFYLRNGTITLDGVAGLGAAGNYNGLDATAFLAVPVSGGSISGLFGTGQTGVLNGFSVAFVPEPGVAGLLGLAAVGAMLRRRRVA